MSLDDHCNCWRRRRESNPRRGFCRPLPEPLGYAARTVCDTRRRLRLPLHPFPSRAETRGWLRTPALLSRSLASGVRSATSSPSTTSTFEVPRGTVTVLLGPNGAGKTTVVRLVTGALHARRGRGAHPRARPDVDDEGTEVRRRCGVVPAAPALYDRLSGTGQPRATRRRCSRSSRRSIDERIAEAADRFGIADALDQKVGGYSTGMRARLALARAVLHDPDLLLLDEPTAGPRPRVGPHACSASSTRWPKTARPSSCARTCCSRPRGSPTR